MRLSLITTTTAVLLLAVAGLSTSAVAGKPKKDLTDSGYKCVRVGVNFIECTKDGSPTYWCDDAGNCEAKPARVKPGDAAAPKGGGVLEVNPGSGKGTKGSAGSGTTVKPMLRKD